MIKVLIHRNRKSKNILQNNLWTTTKKKSMPQLQNIKGLLDIASLGLKRKYMLFPIYMSYVEKQLVAKLSMYYE